MQQEQWQIKRVVYRATAESSRYLAAPELVNKKLFVLRVILSLDRSVAPLHHL